MSNKQLLSFLKMPQFKVYATVNGQRFEIIKAQLAVSLRTVVKENKDAPSIFPTAKVDVETGTITLN